eukprot:CAMPEP_0175352970 /NCGR_PEP_ID=MMETSP0095-20121207/12199_1 /TAXON_ID=311494 /ORGANISM="Alexandrium monilatum, Strain CCMP3105" /LENGTH=620 /DNA_ID=CAMNT_0016650569 /DNA_START=1 /DNA_END=1863 /DNA_ORIENTATION=+
MFADVSDVVLVDRPGYLARSMTVTATKARVQERVYAKERTGEMVCRLLDAADGSETDVEHVIAVKEEPLRLEFFRRAPDGRRAFWPAPLGEVRRTARSLADRAAEAEATSVEAAAGLGVLSEALDVPRDALWQAMLTSVRNPERFFDCSAVSVHERDGCVRRVVTAGGETYAENVYVDGAAGEIVHRRLLADGAKMLLTDVAEENAERVVALRTYPLQVEFFQRSKADGFRAHCGEPKAKVLAVVQAFVEEAGRLAPPCGGPPRGDTIGLGVTSDPVRGCSSASLLAAAELAAREPWRVTGVDQAACEVQDFDGHIERQTLLPTGKKVTEWISVMGREVCCAEGTGAGATESVLAVLAAPLRLELFRRVRGGPRLDWGASQRLARKFFEGVARLARELEGGLGGAVGFGLASRPVVGADRGSLWKAMLRVLRDPAERGERADATPVCDASDFLPTSTDDIHVSEGAGEIVWWPATDCHPAARGEGEAERVFALREDPLRMELFSRCSRSGMHLDWQVPRSRATHLFDAATAAATAVAAAVTWDELACFVGSSLKLVLRMQGAENTRARLLRMELFSRCSRTGVHLDWQVPRSRATRLFDAATAAAAAAAQHMSAGAAGAP